MGTHVEEDIKGQALSLSPCILESRTGFSVNLQLGWQPPSLNTLPVSVTPLGLKACVTPAFHRILGIGT